jgi:uncharacterized membrane protein YgcG
MRHVSLFLAAIALLLIAGDRTSATTFAVVIHDLTAAASPILAGSSTAVSVDATDSGPLSYTWSATGGTISGSGASVSWQAPASAGTFTITCQVTGPSGSVSTSISVASVSGPTQWPSTPPAGCPFPPSTLVPGILFNRFASQHFADTFYPSWAADGALYSPWMDGILLTPGFTQEVIGAANAVTVPARTGWCKILGDDPTNLDVVDAGVIESPRDPYGGRYASASLHHNGVWYYGTYCTMNEGGSNDGFVTIDGIDYNWGVVGPFVGFHTSTDNGHTWTPPPHTPSSPIFGEPAVKGGKLKMGVPHVVDFGRNLQHSPDGKAYLICHGAVDPDPAPRYGNLSWITGDQIYMARVTPSIQDINDPSKYEFFAGHDAGGTATWSSSLASARPVIDWNNNCGGVTMTWFPPLNRYITCIVDGRTTAANMNTYILESPTLTGPFKLVTYMKDFGVQAYFCNFPSKFITGDGNSCWLWYSANFHPLERESNPPGSGYHLCAREVLIQRPVHSNPSAAGGSGSGSSGSSSGGSGGSGGSSSAGGSNASAKDSHGSVYRWCFGAVEAPTGIRAWTILAVLAAILAAIRRR